MQQPVNWGGVHRGNSHKTPFTYKNGYLKQSTFPFRIIPQKTRQFLLLQLLSFLFDTGDAKNGPILNSQVL